VKKNLMLVLRVAIVAGALAYVFWGIDPDRLLSAFASFPLWKLSLLMTGIPCIFLLVSWRLRVLAGQGGPFKHYAAAIFMGYGLNNVLPARLGEAAKVLALRDRLRIPTSQAICAVVVERFCDVSLLALISLVAVFNMDINQTAVAALVAGAVLFWLSAIALRFYPRPFLAVVELIPWLAARRFLGELTVQFSESLQQRVGRGLAISCLIWLFYLLLELSILNWLADLGLTTGQLLQAFVIVSLSFSVPSSPGGLGVVQAAAVFVLERFGIDKETALATGIVWHMILFIPATLGGVVVFIISGLSLRRLHRLEEAEAEAPEPAKACKLPDVEP
jgi:hypothetical protein